MSRIDYNNPHGAGELGLAYHYEMLSDRARVEPFKRAIEKVAEGKIVFESGTGSAILSLIAARAGAKAVYATELDPSIFRFASENVRRAGFDNVHLIPKSTTEVTLADIGGQRVDVVIAENLSTWFVTEPEIQVMNHITEHLARAEAVRIPTEVENTIELCYTNYRFEDLVEVRAEYFEFTGIREPTLFSAPLIAQRVRFDRINAEAIELRLSIEPHTDGVVNGVRLTSPMTVLPDIRFTASDSLMPPVVLPLPESVSVRAGEPVELSIRYRSNSSWRGVELSAQS